MPTFGSFVDGVIGEPAADDQIDVRDPATGTRIAWIEDGGTDAVAAAVEAGTTAFAEWRRVPARDRGAMVAELARRIAADADRLSRLDALDTGNPLAAMRADVAKGVRLMSDARAWPSRSRARRSRCRDSTTRRASRGASSAG